VPLIEADDLFSLYENDPIATDQRYRGRQVDVVGTVTALYVMGDTYQVMLRGSSGLLGVRCQVLASREAGFAGLRKGRRATLRGVVSGAGVTGTVTLKDCTVREGPGAGFGAPAAVPFSLRNKREAAAPNPAPALPSVGAPSLDVADFSYAGYLRQVLQKVQGEWQRQNQVHEPSQKPLVFVEIQRDGSILTPKIEQTSGNQLYDQAALRAVVAASPFLPLPADWPRPSLRVVFRFDLDQPRASFDLDQPRPSP